MASLLISWTPYSTYDKITATREASTYLNLKVPEQKRLV